MTQAASRSWASEEISFVQEKKPHMYACLKTGVIMMGPGMVFDDAERRFDNSAMKPCAFAPRHKAPTAKARQVTATSE